VKDLISLRIQCHNNKPHHGRQQKFFRGGQRWHFTYPFSRCERCNANGLSQNDLPFLHHKENSPWKHALRSHYFEIAFRWSCIRVCERLYLFSSFTAFAGLGYHPISLLLWTADNWVWNGLEVSTTAFAVLTLVCVNWTLILKNLVWNVFYTLAIRNTFSFHKLSIPIFRELYTSKS